MKANCPHCKEEFTFGVTVKQAIGAKTGIRLMPSPGAMLNAVSVGETIAAYARLLTTAAEEVGPHKIMHFIESIKMNKYGAITVSLVTAIKPDNPVQEGE